MMKYLFSFFKIEALIIVVVVVLTLISLIRIAKGQQGTFATSYFYDPLMSKSSYRIMNKKKEFFDTKNKSVKKKSYSKGETECRRVLENYFQKSFPQSRPNFMKNSITGSNLEIDCFNDELKIGCEYHGRQHYEFTPHWHASKQHFFNQKYRDKETRDLCKKNGIFLIEVPYTIPISKIESYIHDKL